MKSAGFHLALSGKSNSRAVENISGHAEMNSAESSAMKIKLLLKLVPVVLFALGMMVGCGGGEEDHEGHDHGDGNASDHDH